MFAGTGTQTGLLVGVANATLDRTPRILVPNLGTVRTRFVTVQGLPNIRVILIRRVNAVTTMTVRLVARTGIGNAAADIVPVSAALGIGAPDIVGTVVSAAATVTSFGMLAVEITNTAGAGDTEFDVFFLATA